MQIQKSTGTEPKGATPFRPKPPSADVVVDTNALVALVDEKDKWHKPAKAIYLKLRKGNYVPIYFDCVVNEAIGVLGRRTREQKRFSDFSQALSKLKNQVPQHAITWASIETKRLYSEALKLAH